MSKFIVVFGSAVLFALNKKEGTRVPRDVDIIYSPLLKKEEAVEVAHKWASKHCLSHLPVDAKEGGESGCVIPVPVEGEPPFQVLLGNVRPSYRYFRGVSSVLRAFGSNATRLGEEMNKIGKIGGFVNSLYIGDDFNNYIEGLTALRSARDHVEESVWKYLVRRSDAFVLLDRLIKKDPDASLSGAGVINPQSAPGAVYAQRTGADWVFGTQFVPQKMNLREILGKIYSDA